MIYLIGSLRNPKIPEIANVLRGHGHEVFEDWYSAGEKADDSWQAYENGRGHNYVQALAGHAAEHVFNFDKKFMDLSDIGVLVLPAGKSGHLELGWMLGKGKKGYILLNGEPERYDVMYKFSDGVFHNLEDLIVVLSHGLGEPITAVSKSA